MYKNVLGINNLQWLICHKTKLNQTKFLPIYRLNDTTSVFYKNGFGIKVDMSLNKETKLNRVQILDKAVYFSLCANALGMYSEW